MPGGLVDEHRARAGTAVLVKVIMFPGQPVPMAFNLVDVVGRTVPLSTNSNGFVMETFVSVVGVDVAVNQFQLQGTGRVSAPAARSLPPRALAPHDTRTQALVINGLSVVNFTLWGKPGLYNVSIDASVSGV
jgi:hypothetical protein